MSANGVGLRSQIRSLCVRVLDCLAAWLCHRAVRASDLAKRLDRRAMTAAAARTAPCCQEAPVTPEAEPPLPPGAQVIEQTCCVPGCGLEARHGPTTFVCSRHWMCLPRSVRELPHKGTYHGHPCLEWKPQDVGLYEAAVQDLVAFAQRKARN